MSYPGYPQQGGGYPQQPPQGGGYPQQGGYPQPGGYPQQGAPGAPGGGYPQPGGFPQAGGYPAQGGGMPQPDFGAGGGLPYGSQPPAVGFGGAPPSVAMPAPVGGPAPTYQQPMNPAYNTPQPGYGQPQPGYGQPPAQGGYPQASGGYPQPGGPPAGGYGQPGAPPAAGYGQPGAPPAAGYGQPGAPPAAGYGQPGAPPAAGYGQPGVPPAGAYGQPGPSQGYQQPPHGGVAMPGMQNLSISGKAGKVKTQGTVRPANPFNPERDAEILRKAMKGFGTDEKAIIDVLGSRTNEQRQRIKLNFKTMYGKDLIKDLKSELGGRLEDVVLALLVEPRLYDAQQIRKAIDGLGTDEDTLIEIMSTRTNKEILEIKEAYKKYFKQDLERALTGDTSGHFRRLMVSLSVGARNEDLPVDYQKAKTDAQALYQAGAGKWGTDESKFNQILCTQSAAQLQACFAEYQQQTGKSIDTAIKNEFSGDIETGLLALVKVARNRSAYFAEKLYQSMKGLGTNDNTLIRLVVTRCEVDMVQIKQEFLKTYGKTVDSFIADDCSGDYKKILMALVR